MQIDIDNLKYRKLAGCDEVGRGPLAGPVVAATVFIHILDQSEAETFLCKLRELGVTDSKKLTAKKRRKILDELDIDLSLANQLVKISYKEFKLSYSIREVSETKIDEINILNASLLAMRNSFMDCYDLGKAKLLIDGNKELNDIPEDVDMEAVIKGDSKSVLIGLASVIAKEFRDDLMKRLSLEYPGYGLEKHAGYPTKMHKEAIVALGITPIHRKSFKGVKEFVQI